MSLEPVISIGGTHGVYSSPPQQPAFNMQFPCQTGGPMTVTITNPNGAIGFLPNIPNTALIPYGETYEVFNHDSNGLALVGLGHILFNPNDFDLHDLP